MNLGEFQWELISIERHAMHGDPTSDGLIQTEQLLFQSFRCLYIAYHAGKIDREQAQIEEKALLARFMDNQRQEEKYRDICKMRVELAKVAKDMTLSDCPVCKRAIAIIDGRSKLSNMGSRSHSRHYFAKAFFNANW